MRIGGRVWLLCGGIVALALGAAGSAAASDGGWGYLIDKLVADGMDRPRVARVFRDRRVGRFAGLDFSLEPRESHRLYRSFRKGGSVARARRCRGEYDRDFRTAERTHEVPASVLSAILYVETQCGQFTGRHVVLQRLARLAMANEPANVRRNIARHTRGVPRPRSSIVEAKVRVRARELEDLFYPEVLATFRIADTLGIDPLGIRGSPSGAFGLPQFLPSSYLRYGVDGNGNGRISLYEPADAIASAANYLVAHGWKQGITPSDERRVLWHYNRSDAYIDTVLYLADRIDRSYPSSLASGE
jgi:membrane-bound lytic murein transglycosylase B